MRKIISSKGTGYQFFALLLLLLSILSLSGIGQDNTTIVSNETALNSTLNVTENGTLAKEGAIEASELMLKSKNTVAFLKAQGISSDRFRDLLTEAELAYEAEDFMRSINISNEIDGLKKHALSAKSSIGEAQVLLEIIKGMDFNAVLSEKRVNQAFDEFIAGNYEEASRLASVSLDEMNGVIEEELERLSGILGGINAISETAGIKIRIIGSYSSRLMAISNEAGELPQARSMILELDKSFKGLFEAKKSISDIKSRALPAARLEDLFNESVHSIELEDFERANELNEKIIFLSGKIIKIRKEMNATYALIQENKENGIDSRASESLLAQGLNKFMLNDFESSEKLVESALNQAGSDKSSGIINEVVQKSDEKFSLSGFLKKHWISIAIVLLLVAVFGEYAHSIYMRKWLKYRIGALKRESEVTIGIIKQLQGDYFSRKTISKASYEAALDKHQERIIQIRETLPVMESRLSDIEKKGKFIFLNNFSSRQ